MIWRVSLAGRRQLARVTFTSLTFESVWRAWQKMRPASQPGAQLRTARMSPYCPNIHTAHRERDDGLYQPMTYICFKLSEEIVVTLLHSLPVSVMMYYTVQLQARADSS